MRKNLATIIASLGLCAALALAVGSAAQDMIGFGAVCA